MKRISSAWIAGALAGVIFFSSCSKEEVETEPLIRPVRYTEVMVTGGSRLRTFSGVAHAGVESQLSFKVAGQVARVNARVGDQVKRGQTLVTLDTKDYRLQVQEAEAALAQAQAQLRNAKSAFDRTMSLYEVNNASKSQLDQARAGYESALHQVESIEKRLELARLQVNYCTLEAPSDGSIKAVNVEADENLSPGQPVVILTSSGRPEVKVTVPEMLISQVKRGSSAKVKFDAVSGTEFDATVTEVGAASTGFASTFPVTVRLNANSDKIRPGMAAEVSFRFETAGTQERLLVPAVSVGEDQNGRFVYVLVPAEEDGFGICKRTAVSVGELTSEGLEITSGLKENDLVVTAGVSKIDDGQKVKLL